MSLVHVVRHGEVFNPDKVLYGRLPGFRLSEFGRAQAEKTAVYLAGRDITYLVSSPLERAVETATPIAAAYDDLPIERDERLIEAANRFEGQQVAGGTSRIAAPSNWKLLYNPIKPSWGEPYAEIAARMRAAVLAAAAAADGHEAVCVTHQLPVVMLRRSALGEHLWHDPRQRQCALASVTTFAVDVTSGGNETSGSNGTSDGNVTRGGDGADPAGTSNDVRFYSYAEPAGATPRGYIGGA